MTVTDHAGDLARRLPGVHILTGGGVDGYAIDGQSPALAVQPSSVEEVAEALRFAGERGLAVAPWGAGTLTDLGNTPRRLDLVLDCSRLAAIVDYAPEDLVVTVQAGISLALLNARLAEHGQLLALDPPLAERATVGGALSAGLWGPGRLRYGTARDLVIGLSVVLADGSLTHSGGRVVKNVAGYDMAKLYLGALGSLGVIVEASFKLQPLPAGRGALIAVFPSCEAAAAASLEVVNSIYGPTAVELIGPPGAARLVADSRAEPRPGSWVMAVLLGGFAAEVERQTREIVRLAERMGSPEVTALERRQRETLFRRLRDYGRSSDDPAAVILRGSVLSTEVVAAAERLAALSEPAPEILISPGAGNVYAYWREAPAELPALVARLRRELAVGEGSLVVERCPPELKREIEVWGIEGPDVELMADLKAAFDPTGILNPGRYVSRL